MIKVKKKKISVDEDPLAVFPPEEQLEDLLRSIPEDMSEAIDMEPALMFEAASRLHGLMSHWTTRLAVATGKHLMSKHARDIGLETIKSDVRELMLQTGQKSTEASIKERAMAARSYAILCRGEAEALTEKIRLQGLVDAIATKREALKMLTFFARQEVEVSSIPQMRGDFSGVAPSRVLSEDVKDSLRMAQAAMDEINED